MTKRRIWVAGHKGMVGSAVTRYLEGRGDEVLKVDRFVVDLRNKIAVELWLKQNRPDAIIFAAATSKSQVEMPSSTMSPSACRIL